MMKISQISFIFSVALLGMFVFSCGQFNTKDEGLDSKSIEEASGSSGVIDDSSGGSGGDSVTDNSTDNTTSSTAGFTISTISGNTTETGGTATFTVKLNTQPTADVKIALSSSDTTEGTVSPSNLSFTTSNYNTAQTVTVTGINDSTVDGNQSFTIILAAATSSDSNYNGLDPADVSVTNTDDETAGFTISAISGNTTEAGGTATFTAKLNSQPTADVSIAVSSSDTTEGTVNPSSLTFSASNYNTSQTVTVTGVDDSTIDGNQSYTVVLAEATSSDSNYNGLNPTDVSVTNTDNDSAGFTISDVSGATTEDGGTAIITMKLNSEPSANVTLTVSSSDTTEGTVSVSSIVFTSLNWNDNHTVTITGIDDAYNDCNQSYTVVLAAASSSDSNYNGLNPSDVNVSNTDNEGVSFCLPDTGQTGDYTSTFGEDSDYTYSAISYSDNGDGTITDGNTGLIWQQQDDGTERNWNDASSYCNDLSLGGQSDWRLPTDKELLSVAHYGSNTSTYSTFFLNTQSSYYWTLTTLVNDTTLVWNVSNRINGYVDINSKTGSNYVRCVRGNQLSSSFTNNGDGTVTDNKTRFVWQREDDGSKRYWESAITYCESLSLASKSDWRLPNIKELQSITDAGQSSPAINTTAFPNTQSQHYWSSTTYLTDTTIAWSILFSGVYVYQNKSKSVHTNYVRCVRGGQ